MLNICDLSEVMASPRERKPTNCASKLWLAGNQFSLTNPAEYL